MKKNVRSLSLLVAIIAAILPVFAGAQQVIAPSVKQHRTAISGKTERLLNKASYEIQNKVSLTTLQPRLNELQLDSIVTFYGYDQSQHADSTPIFRTLYSYPEPNTKIEINSEKSLNDWAPKSQITSIYDEMDRLVEIFVQSYDTLTGEFVPDSKIETFYYNNSSILIDSLAVSDWSTDLEDWVVQLSGWNIYNNENKIVKSFSSMGINEEAILFKDTFLYDTRGDNHLIESTANFEGVELPSGKTENSFVFHLLNASVVYTSDGIDYFPSIRETFLYAPGGIIARHSIMAWNLEIENWQLATTIDYTYDEEQRLSNKFIQYYEDGVPADGEQPTYDYIEGNHLSLETSYLFDEVNERWFIDNKKYYYYNGLTSIPVEHLPVIALSLAPNPTNGIVQIGMDETLTVQLFDITGRRITRQILNPGQNLDISPLPSGVYQLIAQNDKNMYTGRIVKM